MLVVVVVEDCNCGRKPWRNTSLIVMALASHLKLEFPVVDSQARILVERSIADCRKVRVITGSGWPHHMAPLPPDCLPPGI